MEIFNGKKKIYYENDKPDPLNFYGKTKLTIEKYIQKNLENYKIFRTSWNSDIFMGYRCVIELTYKTILGKNAKMAYDNLLSITYVKDLCDAMFKCIFSKEKIIHIANSEFLTRYQLANKIKKYSKRKNQMKFIKCKFSEIKYAEPRGLRNILRSNILKKYQKKKFKKINSIIIKKVHALDQKLSF